MKLYKKIIIGLTLGILFGIFLPDYTIYIKPVGDIFLRLIKLIIAPLLFFSLVAGITSMPDLASLGRVGKKAVAAFLGTTFFAVVFGIAVATLLKPGVGFHFDITSTTPPSSSFTLKTFLENIIPDSFVGAFVNGSILSIVFLGIFTGIALQKMGTVVTPVKDFALILSKITLKILSIIIEFTPYAAFALTAWVISIEGMQIMFGLLKLAGSILLAMACQYLIFGFLISFFCKVSPFPFYKKSIDYQLVAFSTASSKASLGTTMQVCRERLGISQSSTSFLLPLGSAINMDALAINLSLTTLFFAQALGITLNWHDYLMIILTSTLGSIGGAGIPGSSLIMLPLVLSSVHLPIEGIALIAGIDRILDMVRTTINITGDATISLILDNSEGTLDKKTYLAP